jgi:hypothetical protein
MRRLRAAALYKQVQQYFQLSVGLAQLAAVGLKPEGLLSAQMFVVGSQ